MSILYLMIPCTVMLYVTECAPKLYDALVRAFWPRRRRHHRIAR